MNHFADILEHEEDNEHKNGSVLISETIEKIDSADCLKGNHYSPSTYNKFANISLALGLMITPGAVDQVNANNKYNTQIESEWSTSCAKPIDLYSRDEGYSLTEEEEISTISSFYEDFKRVPAKSKRTIKVNVNSIRKGRPSRI
jgi:hypothetical protein